MNEWKSSSAKFDLVKGWLFDIYPSGSDEVTVWIISKNGERVRLTDKYVRKLYVSGDCLDLKALVDQVKDGKFAAGWRFIEKHANFMEASKKTVLEVEVKDYGQAATFARKVLRLGMYEKFHLFNVDLPVVQAYLYEKEIFPLAYVSVVDLGGKLGYEALDAVENCEYTIPQLRSMWLDVDVKKKDVCARFLDPIESISLKPGNQTIIINEGSEADKILMLVKLLRKEDPDIIFTHGGDAFLFPYLYYRALVNGVLNRFILSRENHPLTVKRDHGRSYFSYGRVYYKAPARRLYGRVHIDVDNTFIFTACGLEGLVEVSRTCRVPLHRAARASIGSIMSSLQFYTAWKNEVLVPWKKREPESFKSGWELLVADRGGFVFEPRLGFHTDVVEVDFTSMFPMLMLTRNISAETVLCSCCPDSKVKVPELGYNICEKRRGIVPKTLELLLKKRLRYKTLMKETSDLKLKEIYNMRQAALKWILVTCFGYLGYRNARFGKVDAHIAVCAFARDVLLKTTRLAEEYGFEVVHGIVDSLWLKKTGVSYSEIVKLCRKASEDTGIPLNVEGKYRWIVFLPSKASSQTPVLNRYYGVFEDGRIKMRGIEARRGDTPSFIVKAQVDIIRTLAKASSYEEFVKQIPEALNILKGYVLRLTSRNVDVEELLIAKRLSRRTAEYSHNIFQTVATRQLMSAGFNVQPGQTVQYLITDSKSKKAEERVLAKPLITSKTKYDVEKYLQLLFSAVDTLLGIFGYDANRIQDLLLRREKYLAFS